MTQKHTATILNGTEIANTIKSQLYKNIIKEKSRPGLAAILIGENPASQLYVNIKEKACQQTDIKFHKYLCNEKCFSSADEKEIIDMIKFLNKDPEIDGILVQLPLPEKFNTQKIINAISPDKDADGFHHKKNKILSPVVGAIMELILAVPQLEVKGKKVLAVIKNETFASSLEEELKKVGLKNVTHASTIPKNSVDFDIIIIALGKAGALKKSMVKEGAIVIDVGINKKAGRTVGDVDPKVFEVADYISPVPGGVGPLTVACLLKNTYQLYKQHHTKKSA